MRILRNTMVALLLMGVVPAGAQAPARIAWIWPGTPEGTVTIRAAFLTGMRENGLVEGRDYVLDERYADGKYDRFPALAEDLVKRNPAVLMVNAIAAVRPAQRATRTIPIVFVHINDPVQAGLVASLARPGGNTTGLSNQTEDVIDKYIELVRDILPRTTRIAALINPDNPAHAQLFARLSASAAPFGVAARAFELRTPEGLDAVFGEIVRYRPDVLLGIPEAMFFDQRDRICALASGQRIPAIFPQADFVTSGCLMSYASSRRDLHRRSALFVKKILAGAKPGDLPVEQPTKFELLVNLKTAKALGIAVPPSILIRADEVIQ